jgi:DedD protein
MPLDPEAARTPSETPGRSADEPDRGVASARSSDEIMAEIEADRAADPAPERGRAPDRDDASPDPVTEVPEASIPASTAAEVAAEPSPPASGSSSASSAVAAENVADGGWILQVASFGVEENATDLIEQLTRLGHVASISRLVRGESTLHRVVTGPYATQRDAERAKGQIERTVSGVAPVVRGGSSAAEGLPDDREEARGYAVQLGSFASRNNAVRLLGQLEAQDFDVFIHEDMSGRRTIWRVRVGVTETREQAIELLSEISDRTALEGLVVSHP